MRILEFASPGYPQVRIAREALLHDARPAPQGESQNERLTLKRKRLECCWQLFCVAGIYEVCDPLCSPPLSSVSVETVAPPFFDCSTISQTSPAVRYVTISLWEDCVA
jgi:hypothetical protein